MDIPDELLFKVLELVAEEHDYSDDALWCDGPFRSYRWALTTRQPVEENIVRVRDNRMIHQEQMVRSMRNKLVCRISVAFIGNILNMITKGSHFDVQALVCYGSGTDIPNHRC